MDIGHFRKAASLLGLGQATRLYLSRALGVPSMDLHIPGVRTPVTCRPRDSDRRTLSQIFIERDCEVDLAFSPEHIIDGGANVGYATLFFANKFPQAHILAVEPDQTNWRLATENCREYPNVKVLQGAIWNTHTPLAIGNRDDASWAFKVQEVTAGDADALQAYTIFDLMQMAGAATIDLLKLDIEGAEETLFSDTDNGWIDRTKVIVIELHGDGAERAVLGALNDRNFALSKQGEKLLCVNQAYC